MIRKLQGTEDSENNGNEKYSLLGVMLLVVTL